MFRLYRNRIIYGTGSISYFGVKSLRKLENAHKFSLISTVFFEHFGTFSTCPALDQLPAFGSGLISVHNSPHLSYFPAPCHSRRGRGSWSGRRGRSCGSGSGCARPPASCRGAPSCAGSPPPASCRSATATNRFHFPAPDFIDAPYFQAFF